MRAVFSLLYAALYFGPECGPIFWPRMRPYILAQNAALYFGPECGPILHSYPVVRGLRGHCPLIFGAAL